MGYMSNFFVSDEGMAENLETLYLSSLPLSMVFIYFRKYDGDSILKNDVIFELHFA